MVGVFDLADLYFHPNIQKQLLEKVLDYHRGIYQDEYVCNQPFTITSHSYLVCMRVMDFIPGMYPF